jgi:hypothetical protein
MGWKVQGSNPGSDSDFYVLQIFLTGFGAKPASNSGGTGAVPTELTYEDDNSLLSTAKGKNE